MSKKEIIALADELRGLDYVPDDVVDALCRFCHLCNPNFNRERFIAYLAGRCGRNSGKLTVKGGAV